MKPEQIDLDRLMQMQFAESKFWWGLASITKFSVVLISLVAIFFSNLAFILAIASTILAIMYVFLQWYTEQLKSTAEALLRRLEMHDGLGWPVVGREYADLLLSVPNTVKTKAHNNSDINYFASKQEQSNNRILENLIESTWWTKHQANRMAKYSGIFSMLIIGIAVISMATAMQSALSATTLSNISRVAIAFIVFVFSGGHVRLAFDYKRFAELAARAEHQAEFFLQSSSTSDIQVIKLLHDYQIVRVTSPPLPGWLWKRMEVELNELWRQHSQIENEVS